MNQLNLIFKTYDDSNESRKNLSLNLGTLLKHPVHITFTNNRSNILTSKIENNQYKIRIHKCFANASTQVIKAISTFLTRKNKSASNVIGEFFDTFGPSEEEKKAKRKRKLCYEGTFFNLNDILNDLNNKYFKNSVNVKITWGNSRPKATKKWKKTKHITLGQYRDEENLIIIHPNLDKKRIPKYVVEAIVYHEMCHQLIREEKKNGRRRIHTSKFRELEKKYELIKQAKAWENDNFAYLLRRP